MVSMRKSVSTPAGATQVPTVAKGGSVQPAGSGLQNSSQPVAHNSAPTSQANYSRAGNVHYVQPSDGTSTAVTGPAPLQNPTGPAPLQNPSGASYPAQGVPSQGQEPSNPNFSFVKPIEPKDMNLSFFDGERGPWFNVAVARGVGLTNNWALVKNATTKISDAAYKSYPTLSEAYQKYKEAFGLRGVYISHTTKANRSRSALASPHGPPGTQYNPFTLSPTPPPPSAAAPPLPPLAPPSFVVNVGNQSQPPAGNMPQISGTPAPSAPFTNPVSSPVHLHVYASHVTQNLASPQSQASSGPTTPTPSSKKKKRLTTAHQDLSPLPSASQSAQPLPSSQPPLSFEGEAIDPALLGGSAMEGKGKSRARSESTVVAADAPSAKRQVIWVDSDDEDEDEDEDEEKGQASNYSAAPTPGLAFAARVAPSTPGYPGARSSPAKPGYPGARSSPAKPGYPGARSSPATPSHPGARSSPATPGPGPSTQAAVVASPSDSYDIDGLDLDNPNVFAAVCNAMDMAQSG